MLHRVWGRSCVETGSGVAHTGTLARVRTLAHHRAVIAGASVLAVAASSSGVGPAAAAPRAASVTKITEHVALKLVRRSGSDDFEHTGRATGTIAGSVRSRMTLSHSVVLRGTVTISTSKGKLRLDVSGRARSLELRTKFDGLAKVVGGTGRYARAHGAGTFKGVVNRSTWAATIDATGSISY